MTREEAELILEETPVGRTGWENWLHNREFLIAFTMAGGNPWVYAADERHLEQFWGPEEQTAFEAIDLDWTSDLHPGWNLAAIEKAKGK
jgi:hypothetical protein